MKNRLAMAIRVLTIPPVMALVLLTALYAARREMIGSALNLVLAVVFLVIFPILAYPLQPLLPKLRRQGREGQRNLATWMSFLGYVMGFVCALILPVSGYLLAIYATYLLSGLTFVVLNKVFKFRASGHACGVAGPIFTMIYFISPWLALVLLILPAVYWASLTMGRHTKAELIAGTAIPACALFLSVLIFVGFR